MWVSVTKLWPASHPHMAAAPSDYERHLVPLASPQGQALAAYLQDAALSRVCAASDAFVAQIEPTWCGLASISTALQTLRTLHPSFRSKAESQEELFEVERAARGPSLGPSSRQLRGGLSLAEGEALAARLLRGTAWQDALRRHSADDAHSFAGALGADLDDLASTAGKILLVNVLRQVQGAWTGHWMVVAAAIVDPSGEVWALALDPAAHKLGPHWLPESLLLSTMCTLNYRGEARGYLSLSLAAPSSTSAGLQPHGSQPAAATGPETER